MGAGAEQGKTGEEMLLSQGGVPVYYAGDCLEDIPGQDPVTLAAPEQRRDAVAPIVRSRPTRQLGQRMDEELLARIELVAFSQKRSKGQFTTVRSILEDAARMWLQQFEETRHQKLEDLSGRAEGDDVGAA